MLNRIVFYASVLLALCIFVGCEPSPNISGTATDTSSNQGIAGATVRLTQNGNEIDAVVTDTGGEYGFYSVASGTYTVRIEHANYSFSPDSSTVSFSGSNRVVNFSGVPSVAQKGGVAGYALNPCANQPIAGATVTLNTTPTTATVTDATGFYHFDNVVVGAYTVEIAHDDFSFFPYSGELSVSSGQVVTGNFSGIDTNSAWKKESQGLTYIFLSGSPSQIGCQHGTMLRDELVLLRQQATALIPANVGEIVAPWLSKFDQSEIDEMQALTAYTATADVGNPTGEPAATFQEIVFLNILVDLDAAAGMPAHCSGFAAQGPATSNGKLYQGFNWDGSPDRAILRTLTSALAFYHPEGKNSFVAPMIAGEIGVYTGMNSQKISLDTQGTGGQVNINATSELWTPTIISVRRGLEGASTTNEMVGILTEEQNRYPGLIAIIASATENSMIALEMVGEHAFTRNAQNNVIWAANNLQSPDWSAVPYVSTSDNARSQGFQRLLANPGVEYGSIDVNTSIDIMGYKGYYRWLNYFWVDQPICRDGNGISVVYVPQDGHIYVSAINYPTCESNYTGFDLNDKRPLL